MSKSVDETVFDYFSLLLTEDNDKQIEVTHVALSDSFAEQDIKSSPVVQRQPVQQTATRAVPYAESQPKVSAPKLEKRALEELLAPVFKTEIVEPVVKTLVHTEPVVQPVAKQKLGSTPKITTQAKVKHKEVEKQCVEQQLDTETDLLLQTQVGVTPPSITQDLQQQLDDEFQVLFFKVAGLTLAVPLVSLGGIVEVDRINQIIGRPSWFLGVQSHRDSQLNLVDTCAWVMPEKYDEKLAQTVNYQYLVLLEDSNWGLACESLVNTVLVKKSEVNWRGKAGKRPWLAGVVKQQMCGILNVQALIEMLNAGLGCQDPID